MRRANILAVVVDWLFGILAGWHIGEAIRGGESLSAAVWAMAMALYVAADCVRGRRQ